MPIVGDVSQPMPALEAVASPNVPVTVHFDVLLAPVFSLEAAAS
jgi:hypothetical protein